MRSRLQRGWTFEDAISRPSVHDSRSSVIGRLRAEGRESDADVVYARIKNGWDIDRAISTPVGANRKRKQDVYTACKTAGRLDDFRLVYSRVVDGWSIEDALTRPKRQGLATAKIAATQLGITAERWSARRRQGWTEAEMALPAYGRSQRSPARAYLASEASRLGMTTRGLLRRVERVGLEAALNPEAHGLFASGRRKRTDTVKALADKFGVPYVALINRRSRGARTMDAIAALKKPKRINEPDVRLIRRKMQGLSPRAGHANSAYREQIRKLAAHYRVTEACVYLIATRKTWPHVA